MINVIEQVLEWTIRHTLEVSYIRLTANPKSIGDNILDASHWLLPASCLDAMRADVGKHLADLAANVTRFIPCTVVKGQTLTVINPVDFP